MCETFLKHCVRTTFPDHRQHFMKAIKQFLLRLRTTFAQEIKKYVGGAQKSDELQKLIDFLKTVINFCEQSLYVDKPIETALPLFEVLKII